MLQLDAYLLISQMREFRIKIELGHSGQILKPLQKFLKHTWNKIKCEIKNVQVQKFLLLSGKFFKMFSPYSG